MISKEKANEIIITLSRYEKEVERAIAYRDGYIQACEDYVREMRYAITNNQG